MTKNDRDMLARLIAFFVILAIIFLFVHFCMDEAKGQTPPANPVTQEWDVDQLGVYLNTSDTYRVLQQHEAKIDTNALEIDTLIAHRDTLHNRIDSIAVRDDSVFYAYDAVGNNSIAAGDLERIALDTEVREDGIFVHVADEYAVECNSAGWYRIWHDVSVYNGAGALEFPVMTHISRFTSGSWAAIAGSETAITTPDKASAKVSTSGTIMVELVSGDSIAIAINNGGATYDIKTWAGSIRLGIEKLH